MWSTVQTHGGREYQEDRFWTHNDGKGIMRAVVCDGHGGFEASEFVTRYLSNPRRKWNMETASSTLSRCVNVWDRKCLRALGCQTLRSFPQTEAERKKLFNAASDECLRIYERHGYISGSTVVMVYLDTKAGIGRVINLGDSRATWKTMKRGERLHATKDHKPKPNQLWGPIEGKITIDPGDSARINGDLAVGRAFGDNSTDLMGTVPSVPDMYDVKWDPTQEFRMVIATDGLWDDVNNSFSIRHAKDPQRLEHEARKQGSTDNVTIVSLVLKP